ncbi:MAG: FxDxF family PEP-CTERM protein [Aquabacterium sp.]
MKLNAFFAALTVACAGSAMAAPLASSVPPGGNLGALSPLQANFADVGLAGAFTDSFSFTVSDKSIVTGSLGALFGAVDISSVAFDGGAPVTLTNIASGVGFYSSALSAGSHTLTIKGAFSGPFNAYQGSVYATAAPVPEPESLALALAGLGVTASVVRRRSRRA